MLASFTPQRDNTSSAHRNTNRSGDEVWFDTIRPRTLVRSKNHRVEVWRNFTAGETRGEITLRQRYETLTEAMTRCGSAQFSRIFAPEVCRNPAAG